ncbi:conserved oligomeric Golgi complex subunit 2 [Cimex lectularius]|uniref:Conserved oligomeric Golgi complex subunit 2 n=1 Tax=Cimex lectularius TaxID=79782 RepID=A0A8I6RSY0_CIMLE|nr:conserved oligomeric Golgi complex subunit 2 [Cimex lectularius]
MEADKEDSVVPLGPSNLCFDSSSFVKDSFSVDKFLKDHRNKANLETMRDDLGVYLKVLRSALIDLINKDYADFVNLSSNLIGLDKAIKKIQTPLGQLREELLQVRFSLDSAMSEISNHLVLRHELREKKRSLRSLSRVHVSLKKLKTILSSSTEGDSSVNLLLLERATTEFCQLEFHVQKCRKDLSQNDLEDFEYVGNLLIGCVDKIFLEALSSGEAGRGMLGQSLDFYHTLDKLENAERLYQNKIVSPVMEKLINENNLRSLPRGLAALYDKIIEFLENNMKILLDVSSEFNKNLKENRCKFFLRSFWPEVVKRLELNLPSIYAAGDPDVFYQRYSETLAFLSTLYEKCDEETLFELNSHTSFSTFMDKWSLPIYFQLRFQEIAKDIESSFAQSDWKSISNEWKLVATEHVWRCLHRCWAPGVFLQPLAHKFWKLSLQIISRYVTWINEVTKPNSEASKTDIDFLVYFYTDVEFLIKKLPEFQTIVLNQLTKLSEDTTNRMKLSLGEGEEQLKNEMSNISSSIIRILSSESISVLRQVNDIPRLYRRTNRDSPTKPCAYVTTLLENPTQFYEKHKSNRNTRSWLQTMFSTVTKQYYSSVDDVLNSMQKTEESLRRLKKARDRSSNVIQPNDRRTSDDNKIRLQLLLDVQAYHQGIERFGLNQNNVEQLNDLILLVGASQKN